MSLLPAGAISAYLARIGYTGPLAPTLETLNAIVARHVQTIPFENLDVLLGEPISIEPAAVADKLVRQHRGGYCFEHNTLLLHVLRALDFSVEALSARSRYQLPERNYLPRTHVFLQVTVAGTPYLVDGGFGGLSPTAALSLEPGLTQETPHEPRRLVLEGNWAGLELRAPDAVLVHQAYFTDTWHDLYELTLELMPLSDREMGNWYTSAHPKSRFKQHLMVARATADGRVALRDFELTWYGRGSAIKTETLGSHHELVAALGRYFELDFRP